MGFHPTRGMAEVDEMLRTLCQASDLVSKSEENQVNMLLYSLGNKADDSLLSFNLSEHRIKKKKKIENHFVKCLNKICG